ncbi:DNA repair protein rad51c [Homalodisca vitripennis]|nr:DNA repair protein rad51c [Homalodisca vitripennis]
MTPKALLSVQHTTHINTISYTSKYVSLVAHIYYSFYIVVVTNHLTTRISPGENQLIPALGESLGHLMTHRLMFGFLPNDGYFAAVNFKSPSFQNDSAEFQVGPKDTGSFKSGYRR